MMEKDRHGQDTNIFLHSTRVILSHKPISLQLKTQTYPLKNLNKLIRYLSGVYSIQFTVLGKNGEHENSDLIF